MAATSVPFSTSSLQPRHRPTVSENQHRRRDLLGRIAGEPVAAVPAAASAAEGGDPHLAWLQEGLAARDIYNASNDPARDERHSDRYMDLRERIMTTPPTTALGVAAQLMVLVDALHEGVDFSGPTTDRVLRWAGQVLPVPAWAERTASEWRA